jgi:hypothetical protein
MPEQPQWSERTLDMPPQDPWADEPTAPGTPPPAQSPFMQGRARVDPSAHRQRHTAEHEPTGVGWPGAGAPAAARGMSWRWSELRRGSEWSDFALLFAFVCWGVRALSSGGPLGTPVIVFLVTVAVAVGVFCLARVVGYLVLERQFGRVRRSARGSHLVTALFLVGVGVADLQQTEWVMTAFHWVAGQVS